ncbi:hypothetical protein [Neobacillus ginsengisoli]|uniref:Uncharacterized protein n=1 Tax=Neobacillus ginsengisoli TaxID=904295 RepID=A0ABT9XSP1_9BACI|nr:hypothetical protein [Neobacillus ginsengisoli]MDQ0197952.1 hypothetical protein [Neobacillus ginsengisoli]
MYNMTDRERIMMDNMIKIQQDRRQQEERTAQTFKERQAYRYHDIDYMRCYGLTDNDHRSDCIIDQYDDTTEIECDVV